MRDHHRSSPFEQHFQRLLDLPFRITVYIRRRLIQDENRGVRDQRAGKTDELSLAK